jgi:phosphatidylglycerol:prolipoprotein diacylglycerol transferase
MKLKRKFSGEVVAVYFGLYGILRSLVEWLRADSLMLGNIKVSLLLSIILVICSIVFIVRNRKKIS